MTLEVDSIAEVALARLRERGFDAAQATVAETLRREVNIAHNEPSLLHSGEKHKLALVGIKDARRAATEGSDTSEAGIAALVEELWRSTLAAPQDEANALSAGQRARFEQGPREGDAAEITGAARALLDWRAGETPSMMIEEALAAHMRLRQRTLTSGGSDIACDLGWYEFGVFGLAREGGQASSFNYSGGQADTLAGVPARFGAETMMRALVRQVHTQPLAERFVGDVVFTPAAVTDLIGWLMQQLGDGPLIDGSSLYRERVGELVASPLLTLQSRYDAPGCVPLTADAFVAPAATLLDAGRLTQLAPSLYGSRKTGVPHRPLAASGWELAAGTMPLADIIAAVSRGALVDRLSMGMPAPNGDFSGVIKNSFLIEGGRVGAALSETMIAGNVAQMLRDVAAVSRERLDTGAECLPWLRVPGLHFS
ncbi:MAG: metallopeptidase TldD-related protein [Rubrivivax sp.]